MNEKVFQDREILTKAHARGPISTLFAFFRLSGPGWLQSAITLGGGSLGGALYLGMLSGTNMLWLQLIAIAIGVVMLSAIAYVTLSTGKRPYAAINEYVNPVLGVSWITATIIANMVWIMPQFSLAYDALDKNLLPDQGLSSNPLDQMLISAGIALIAFIIVIMSFRPGWMSRLFDMMLKLIVGVVVLCFVGVAYKLFASGAVNWGDVLNGLIPDISQWSSMSPQLQSIASNMPGEESVYWTDKIIDSQRNSMIGVTATAVGLNMTFLLPYSMLARGWDKPFRGMSKFDLITGMAIPYLIVTTCIVIASANAFHAHKDQQLLSKDPMVITESVLFNNAMVGIFEGRYNDLMDKTKVKEANEALAALEEKLGTADLDPEVKSELEAQKKTLEAKKIARARGRQKAALLSGEIDSTKAEVKRLSSALANPRLDETKAKTLKEELSTAQGKHKLAVAKFAASLSTDERQLASALLKPDTKQLAATMAPLFGEGEKGQKTAKIIFGIGALAMAFSTIIILSLINGYAFAEIFGDLNNVAARIFGAFICMAGGVCWSFIWVGGSKTWLIIVASTFAAILLPIAYIAFFALMNNKRLLGAEKPTGVRMSIWNILMTIGVAGAIVQAWGAIDLKLGDEETGPMVLGGLVVLGLLALIGFSATPKGVANHTAQMTEEQIEA